MMRLPWGSIPNIISKYLYDREANFMGCLSFEERCTATPEIIFRKMGSSNNFTLLDIRDPEDAFPNYSEQTFDKIESNRKYLYTCGVPMNAPITGLLANEDQLLELYSNFIQSLVSGTVILDITSLPKRFFCFFIKKMMYDAKCEDVVVTYTQTAAGGYPPTCLAEDPMTCDHLPGFAAVHGTSNNTMVLSLGFESLNISSLIDTFKYQRRRIKYLTGFPPNGQYTKRQWRTLIHLTECNPNDFEENSFAVISVWDSEKVYQLLAQWKAESEGMILVPFGPKPHSLAMALFATKHRDVGIYYTQPKSYNPDYSTGRGKCWAYVIKWNGTACYDVS